ncbi:hypothetical protein C2S51_013563 [Perilla frutescens var. frutescens]|nr:hypothetical protein C2S51_013563 [Perilla frutescens var. frutescens]
MACRTACICCICCLLFFVAPFVILITLSYVGVEPRFYIQELYVPALNNNSHMSINNATNLNNSIFMDLKFKRVVAFVPLRYEDLNITLFYGSNSNRSFPVGYYVVPGFYQGTKKTVHRRAVVAARGMPWEVDAISGVGLAVELATKYKLKQCDGDGGCSYSKPKATVVAAHLQLDASGRMRKLSNKPLRLH